MLHELCRRKQSLELWTVSTCFPLSETNDQFTTAFYVTTPTKKKPWQTKKIGHKISQAIHKRRGALLHLACCHTINCRQYKINYYYMYIQYILILITFTTAALKKKMNQKQAYYQYATFARVAFHRFYTCIKCLQPPYFLLCIRVYQLKHTWIHQHLLRGKARTFWRHSCNDNRRQFSSF